MVRCCSIPTTGRKRWDAPWRRERAQRGGGLGAATRRPYDREITRRKKGGLPMTRASGATGIRLLSRILVLPLVAAMVLTLLVPYDAQAVHDTGKFQLDGNALTSLQPPLPAPQNSEDWDMVCPAPPDPRSRPATDPIHCLGGTTADPTTFDADAFGSATDDVFTGGRSKDDLDIPGNVKWQQAAPSPDKDDLEHGFAAEYNITTGTYAGHKVLYFGGDRFSNEGDANIAFWFFQAGVSEV